MIFLKQVKPEFSLYISIFVCIGLFVVCLQKIGSFFGQVEGLIENCKDFAPFFHILIKMIGISFTSEVTIGICKDAGLSAVAEGMEILTRIILCLVSLPVLEEILSLLNTYL